LFKAGDAKSTGASIAKALAASGAVVGNFTADEAEADRLVSEIELADGVTVPIHANLADDADIERLLATMAGLQAARQSG
jgi:NAD(P)-dependent dehydrogenase (short-subunit alcohol dehydrogenase family)